MLIITLQAKGGVGKSFVTSALTQFCHSIGQPVALFDADPNNATLLATPALGAEPLDLLGAGEGMAIDEAAFDGLMERMTTEPADKVLLVDAGATTFLPLFNYVVSHAIWELCTEYQHPLVLHPVITGGPDCEESVLGFATLASQVECPFLITTNPYHGPVSIQGRSIDEHPAYQEHSGSVLARAALWPLLARQALGAFGSGRSRYGNGREGGGHEVEGPVHGEDAVENRLQVEFAFPLCFALLLRRFFRAAFPLRFGLPFRRFFLCFRFRLRLRRHAFSPFRIWSSKTAAPIAATAPNVGRRRREPCTANAGKCGQMRACGDFGAFRLRFGGG